MRAVSADDGSGEVFGASSPATALGLFDDNVVLAYVGTAVAGDMRAIQSSDIQPSLGLFYGGGIASAFYVSLGPEATDPTLAAASTFSVLFDITAPHSYHLIGELDNDFGQGGAGFGLLGATSFTFSAFGGGTSLNSSGVLEAGSYSLFAFATAVTSARTEDNSTFDFILRIEEITVPEPATLTLLALGFGGLGFLRRRHRGL